MSGRAKAAELRIMAAMSREKPNYSAMAGTLAGSVRRFFEDPENERAFREWQKDREAKRTR